MKIRLIEIYAGLEAWRDERKITAESQKDGYIVNVMQELGELAQAIRDYEKIKNGEQVIKKYIAKEWNENNTKWAVLKHKKVTLADAEHSIIDALCDIAIFTINSSAHIPCEIKPLFIEFKTETSLHDYYLSPDYILKQLVEKCAEFSYFEYEEARRFKIILGNCAYLCQHYGYNFQLAMLETIKEISSRTGSYDESAGKWIKDTSPEAKSKWHKADYELARIENGK